MSKTKLDDFEQQIEDDADQFAPVVGEERTRIEGILKRVARPGISTSA